MDMKIFWEIAELSVIMLIIATAAYIPLGYFIHNYTSGSSNPFGKHDPHPENQEHEAVDSH
jgi:hypothetical protein